MFKAQQTALVQQTNQLLVSIRQSELNYYTSFYYTFGCQAAFIGGFAYTAITQVSFPSGADYERSQFNYCEDLFWCSNALCLIACQHVIVTTIFLQVLGPGMALHGPIGSMAKAAEGMRSQMKSVFVAYVVAIMAFALSVFFSFWGLMYLEAAATSTVLFTLSSLAWWKYCTRIYNKFYLDPVIPETLGNFNETDERESQHSQMDGGMRDPTKPSTNHGSSSSPISPNKSKASQSGNIFSFLRNKPVKGSAVGHTLTNPNESSCPVTTTIAASSSDGLMEGYLTKLGKGNNWTRRYFVLTRTGNLFYYTGKLDYQNSPKSPIKERPIEVRLYSVTCTANEDDGLFEMKLDVKDGEEGGRCWVFRCDTDDELEQWQEALKRWTKDR